MDVAEALRRTRHRAGLTQRELSARTGVPQPRIAEYEADRSVPPADRLAVLLAACGATLTIRAPEAEAATDDVDSHDRQLLSVHLAMTPVERLENFSRRARLRGAGLQKQ